MATCNLQFAFFLVPLHTKLIVNYQLLKMYYVEKTMEISGSHYLKLSKESKCEALHGHNWIVKVYCKARELNADGMVVDFTDIKHAGTHSPGDSIPEMALGKLIDEGDRKLMSVSIVVNHGLADGRHLGQFFDAI